MGQLIVVKDGAAVLNAGVASAIAQFEAEMKRLKAQEEELKAAILREMEENELIKIDTPELALTYVGETMRETFDTKRFKTENRDVYDEYVKLSPVKASVSVKVKENVAS